MINGVLRVLNMKIKLLNGIIFHFNMDLMLKLKQDIVIRRSISNLRILRLQIIMLKRRIILQLNY